MSYEDRKRKAIRYLEEAGFVTFKDLSNMLNVSEMTVRRDVRKLENERIINRKYKGIELIKGYNSIITSTLDTNVSIHHNYDNDDNYKIVQEIAKKMISYKNIFLDTGKLNIELAKYVAANEKDFNSKDFITSDIEITSILGDVNLNVYIVSGKVMKNYVNIVDSISSQFLNNIIFDLLILSPAAIDIDFGLSEYNIYDASTKKLLINRSNNILLLVKPNAFDKKALYKIANLDDKFSCIAMREEEKTFSKYEGIINIVYI
jgi:DeoR/GlpR family transcriptional regulator of sugar metabolism